MSTRHTSPITDEQLRSALERRPDAQRMVDDLALIVATVERTGRRPSQTTGWLRVAAVFVALALLMILAVALAVGSRPHLPRPYGAARTGLVAVDDDGDIWVANADGSGRSRLTSGPAFDWEPLWSPDGTKLVYWSTPTPLNECGCHAGPLNLMLLDMSSPDSPGRSLVSTASGTDGSRRRPAWAPDSRHLAYSDTVDGIRKIFVTSTDSHQPVEIGPPDLDGWDPTWSPDGQHIAFVRGHKDVAQRGLYVMAPDGSGFRQLSTIPSKGAGFLLPVWSPLGDRLAFAAETGGSDAFQRDIWVVGLGGQPEVDVSNDPADERDPDWSPDGQSLAYVRLIDPAQHRYHVVVTPLDGAGAITLPQDVGLGTVVWSPDSRQILVHPLDSSQEIAIDWRTGRSVVIAEGSATGVGSWQRLAP